MTPLQLDSGSASLVVSVESDRLCLLHLGPRLTTDTSSLAALSAPVIPHGELDRETLLLAYPCQDGSPGPMPALELQRQGRRLLTDLRVVDASVDGQCLSVNLADPLAAVTLNYRVVPSGQGAFTFQVTLGNSGEDALGVDWLASGHIPLPSHLKRIFSHGGTWANEFQPREAPVADHLQSWISDRGRSSHGTSASLVLGDSQLSEERGNALQVALLWPGNHCLSVGPLREGGYGVQGGVLLEPGELVLEPGESHTGPALVVATSDLGRNGLRAAMKQFWMCHTPRSNATQRPLHFNSWEGCYFDHDEPSMHKLIAAAKELGAERFVLDDGWMEGRSAPGVGLGDWRPSPLRYPQGLKPIADATRDAGMEFGLWVEPESVTLDSQIAKEHPDWIVRADGRALITGRGQYLLNISLGAVQAHILQCLDRLMDEASPAYVKWDMNRDHAHIGRESSTRSMAMTNSFLHLVAQFRQRHPNIDLELCGAGGARSDAGTQSLAHRLWPTDSLDPLQRWHVARQSSVLLAPEFLGWHIGSAPAETSGASLPLNTRCMLALLGHMGIELDPAKLDNAERDTLKHWTGVYKMERHWLAKANWQFLDTHPGDAEALLVSARDGAKAWLFLLQVSYPQAGHPGLLRLPALPPDRHYRLTPLNPDDHAFAQRLPRWTEGGSIAATSGELLGRCGMRPPPLRYGNCALIQIEAVDDT